METGISAAPGRAMSLMQWTSSLSLGFGDLSSLATVGMRERLMSPMRRTGPLGDGF